MTLVRWSDPFREFAQLQDRINRAFSDTYGRGDDGLLTSGSWVPPVDIYQNGEHEVVLKAELPDLTREDIDITVERHPHDPRREEAFERRKRSRSAASSGAITFSRSFSLPQTVDAAKVGAEYKNGVLTVRLPLREEAKPRQIKVDVAA
jgi:HSP20 family protein